MGNKQTLFEHLERNFEGVTFDELTIKDERPSDLDWRDVDLSSSISRNIRCGMPILTSPMATVTEAEMAIAAAKEGGGGVIHHANTPEEQKRMVRKIKLYLNGMVDEPVVARADDSVEATLNMLNSQGHEFRTLPVVDENERFIGLMTNTHFKLFGSEDQTRLISEAMTPANEVFSSNSDVKENPSRAYEIMKQKKIKLLPLLTHDMRIDGLYLLDDVLRVVEGNPRGYNLDLAGRLRTFMSVSTFEEDALERIRLSGKYLDLVVVDTSHAESKYSFSTIRAIKELRNLIKNIREEFGAIDLMVGNVSDEYLATELAKEQPDVLRVGRGPGGICISRAKLGGGNPQATAIYMCSRAAKAIDPNIKICADGGIRGPGDFVKALALDADLIMVGGYAAGTDEAAAKVMTRADGSQYKIYAGMGSEYEQRRSRAGKDRYGAEEEDEIFVEGIVKELPPQGPVARKFRDLVRGAKIEMATGGYANIQELQAGVSFRRVTAAGLQEGQASN